MLFVIYQLDGPHDVEDVTELFPHPRAQALLPQESGQFNHKIVLKVNQFFLVIFS